MVSAVRVSYREENNLFLQIACNNLRLANELNLIMRSEFGIETVESCFRQESGNRMIQQIFPVDVRLFAKVYERTSEIINRTKLISI